MEAITSEISWFQYFNKGCKKLRYAKYHFMYYQCLHRNRVHESLSNLQRTLAFIKQDIVFSLFRKIHKYWFNQRVDILNLCKCG